jgi:hypothetical protein
MIAAVREREPGDSRDGSPQEGPDTDL